MKSKILNTVIIYLLLSSECFAFERYNPCVCIALSSPTNLLFINSFSITHFSKSISNKCTYNQSFSSNERTNISTLLSQCFIQKTDFSNAFKIDFSILTLGTGRQNATTEIPFFNQLKKSEQELLTLNIKREPLFTTTLVEGNEFFQSMGLAIIIKSRLVTKKKLEINNSIFLTRYKYRNNARKLKSLTIQNTGTFYLNASVILNVLLQYEYMESEIRANTSLTFKLGENKKLHFSFNGARNMSQKMNPFNVQLVDNKGMYLKYNYTF